MFSTVAVPGPITDLLIWLIVLVFFVSSGLVTSHRQSARYFAAFGWVLFSIFWLLLTPHFAFTQKSIVEGLGSLAAVPLALLVAKRVYNGYDGLFQLTRAVSLMGFIYLPFITIPSLAQFLIETVTLQSYTLLDVLGHSPTLVEGPGGYRSRFQFTTASGHVLWLHVILACTGIGSMSIMAGIINATDATARKRAALTAVVIPIIWVLNLGRVTFITLSHGHQWFSHPALVDPILLLFGSSDPYKVSYFISDRIIAQTLSVVAILALIWALFSILPETKSFVEKTIGGLTRRDINL